MKNDLHLAFYEYLDFLKIPSISIENTGMRESVIWLQTIFKKMNATEVEVWDEFGSAPMIMGKFEGKSAKTILIYNHYDVQPIEDINLWNSDPFNPTMVEDKIYARGASDCKGEIISRLIAIDYLQKNGGLPCNIIFIIEGEEEIGSPNLSKYLKKHQDKIKADVCLWECGWKNEDEQLEICCGVKGILSFDLEIKTAAQSIHSSYANIVPNAANRLAHALSLLTNAENQIIIPNFNQDILPLDEMTIEAFKRLSINYAKMKTNFGIDQKWHMSARVDKLYNQPTLNISQIQAGSAYSNNSIPNTATAKIDCRFLPGQKPEKLLKITRTYLDEKGYSDVNIINPKSEESYRSNLNSEYVTSLLKCAGTIYGSENVKLIPNFAGGGPMSLFGNLFNIPIVSLGVSYSGSNVHSPNENIRLKDLEQNIQCLLDWFSMIK